MYTETEWRKIAGPKATFVGLAVARDLLAMDDAPRVYGITREAPNEIQRVHTPEAVDASAWLKVWVSDASVFDLIGKA